MAVVVKVAGLIPTRVTKGPVGSASSAEIPARTVPEDGRIQTAAAPAGRSTVHEESATPWAGIDVTAPEGPTT